MSRVVESVIKEAVSNGLPESAMPCFTDRTSARKARRQSAAATKRRCWLVGSAKSLARLNPNLLVETMEDVLRKVRQAETPSLIEENLRLHRYLIEGVSIEVTREDGSIAGDVVRLIDFDEFLAEIQGMEKKNLALEALHKLINGELPSRSRVNVVQTGPSPKGWRKQSPATTAMPSQQQRSSRN